MWNVEEIELLICYHVLNVIIKYKPNQSKNELITVYGVCWYKDPTQ